jgi:hypothetical protein
MVACLENSSKINRFWFWQPVGEFGRGLALCQDMMHVTIENSERGGQGPCCSHQEAAQLLATLRNLYQSVPPGARQQVKNVISRAASIQLSKELCGETPCFE